MRHFLLIFLVINLIGCSNPEKKARRLIKQELKETLHDWDSYESVKFGLLDSVYTTVLDDSVYAIAFNRFAKFALEVEDNMEAMREYLDKMKKANSPYMKTYYYNQFKYIQEENKPLVDSMAPYGPFLDSIKNNFIPTQKGWSMEHSFRCNDAGGNKTIHHILYYFDKDILKIITSDNVEAKE